MKYALSMAVSALLFLSGCAHQIQINPKSDAFAASESPIDKVVGYHISDTSRTKKVTTPGGGGDKVSYTPYKDTESILFTVLSNKFKDVFLVKNLDDSSFIKDNEIQLIFVPTITTNSSSSSFLTWPPTNFTVDLKVKAIDATGNIVWENSVQAQGEAEFDEFKSDFSLAARRATEQAFLKLADVIEQEESFK